MYHKLIRLISLLLILTALPLAPAPPAKAHEPSRPVLAYYFGWWGSQTWNSFGRSDSPTSFYESNDDSTMRTQIRQAKGAGIDGFICTWHYNCPRLVQLAEQEGGFSIAFSVDPVADPSMTSFDAVVGAMHAMSGWTGSPAYLRWAGKPVFVFWNNTILPGDSSIAAFQRLRDAVDPGRGQFWLGGGVDFNYLDVFDAIHFFDITWESSPGAAMNSYSRKLNEYNSSRGASKPFVASVAPGYNDSGVPGREHHVRDREGGNYYRATWDQAIGHNPRAIIINSWNEWYEGTQIEPSVSYGTLYLDITREKVGVYKSLPFPFADEAFTRTWNRTDKAIVDGRTSRSWVWGPARSDGRWEPYNGGGRLVQYFDKSRMEINNPGGDRSSQWFVTNGLLVQEMIDGRLQLGDSSFEQRGPSSEVLAGDPRGVNPNVPGYDALRGHLGRVENRTGAVIDQQLFNDGAVSRITPPYAVKNATYINETGHNIPEVFWNFMNQSGLIWNGSHYVSGPIVDWLFAFGYPITDAFWVRTKIGGAEQWVLVQAFQRRVLTYTPTNSAGFQVEMGNVGQHYHQWRYGWSW